MQHVCTGALAPYYRYVPDVIGYLYYNNKKLKSHTEECTTGIKILIYSTAAIRARAAGPKKIKYL